MQTSLRGKVYSLHHLSKIPRYFSTLCMKLVTFNDYMHITCVGNHFHETELTLQRALILLIKKKDMHAMRSSNFGSPWSIHVSFVPLASINWHTALAKPSLQVSFCYSETHGSLYSRSEFASCHTRHLGVRSTYRKLK